MKGKIALQFCACPPDKLPRQLYLEGADYELKEIIKNDFFATTCIYRRTAGDCGAPKAMILKSSRQNHIAGFPLEWLGRILCDHEVSVLNHLKGIEHIPRLMSRVSPTSFVYAYIEGRTLDDKPKLPDSFFDELLVLLEKIHKAGVIYFDLNKRGNIILGDDGKPYLIDFQIAQLMWHDVFFSKSLARRINEKLISADIYHLYKHKRKFCPDLLTEEERSLSYCKNRLIQAHRMIADPYKKVRRAFMEFMFKKGLMIRQKD